MNFSRVGAYCYHFSERELNWKSSASMCRALGSRLAEFETVEENQDIVGFMQATSALRGTVLSLQMLYVMAQQILNVHAQLMIKRMAHAFIMMRVYSTISYVPYK
jgi:hypothetical protein